MPSDEDVIRDFYELARAGDRACWELWAGDASSEAPPDFPEGGAVHGLDEIQRLFGDWRNAFGDRWWEGIVLEEVTPIAGGRVLADVRFEVAGGTSGVPVSHAAAVVYTLENGRIVHARHFMDRAAAREVAAT